MVKIVNKKGCEKKDLKNNYWIIENDSISSQNRIVANAYLKVLKLANKSEATIDKYRSVIERFLIDCPKNLDELYPEDVHTWLKHRFGDKKERTQELILAVLSGFFKFCLNEDYIERTLTKNRWRPNIPKSLPKYLNDHELARVKLQAERLPLRDRALIEFLFSSGCRRSEVVGLNVEHLDISERTAQVMGKGRKLREVHFSEETALLLNDHLLNHPDHEPALFISKFNKRLGPQGVYSICRKLGNRAELPQNLSPHCCRHTFATSMLARGADLQFIGEELGHYDLNTTRIYARIPSEEIMGEYRKRME